MKSVQWGEVRVDDGVERVRLSCWRRRGGRATLLYLHGLGSTKRDLVGALDVASLESFQLLACDYPGCGRSPYPRRGALSVERIAAAAHALLDAHRIRRVVVIGHSTGGVAGLLLAERLGLRVAGFVNVEGNLASTDCFWSSRIARHAGEAGYYDRFQEQLQATRAPGFQVVASQFRQSVTPRAFFDIGRSLVEQTRSGHLLERFLSLPVPRLFIHGAMNSGLPYLSALRQSGVTVASIPGSHHFPAYSNPEAYYGAVADFVRRATGDVRRAYVPRAMCDVHTSNV